MQPSLSEVSVAQTGVLFSFPTKEGTTDLTRKSLALLRLKEAVVHLVGSGDHGRYGVLVTWRDDSQEREGSQGQVVHAAGHAALIVAVGVQTRGGRGYSRVDSKERKQGRK